MLLWDNIMVFVQGEGSSEVFLRERCIDRGAGAKNPGLTWGQNEDYKPNCVPFVDIQLAGILQFGPK
jgi:hypothetical protein